MNKPLNTAQQWEDHYAPSSMFSKLFEDYKILKNKVRSAFENTQFRVVCNLIDGRMTTA
jgi:hypothetical protein